MRSDAKHLVLLQFHLIPQPGPEQFLLGHPVLRFTMASSGREPEWSWTNKMLKVGPSP